MKKLWLVLGFLAFTAACSDKNNEEKNTEDLPMEAVLEEGEQVVVRPNFDVKFEDEVYKYNLANIQSGCDKGSEIVCAIDLAAKCTINPDFAECDKAKMPKFLFMSKESLTMDDGTSVRPTEMTVQITKIKPIDANMIEVYTKGTCNGTWFGVCEGNIIYVLNNKSGKWIVKDIYNRQSY